MTITLTDPQLRIAVHTSVCAAPGCRRLIDPGHLIRKGPDGGAWRHDDCGQPVRMRGQRARLGARR